MNSELEGPRGELYSRLEDLPPSAKLVFTVLQEEGALTSEQLVEETRLSPGRSGMPSGCSNATGS